jgi:hypothetical protein
MLFSVLTMTFIHFSIADNMPKSYAVSCTERLRQAFVGYDGLPGHVKRQPLRLYVHNIRGKLHVGVNEFQTVLNSLPIATVNAEARSQAANFCRSQTKNIDMFYTSDAHDDPSQSIGDEIQEPVFVQATTVGITTTWDENDGRPPIFESAEHLVDIISRVFGTCVERLVFNSVFESHRTLEEMYWPHNVQTVELGWLSV